MVSIWRSEPRSTWNHLRISGDAAGLEWTPIAWLVA